MTILTARDPAFITAHQLKHLTPRHGAHPAIANVVAKLKVMPEEAIISGFRHKVDFYYNMGIPCARKWPRSPGKKRSPAVMAGWAAFSYIADKWQLLPQEIRDTYNQMASGTGLSGRDLFTRSYMSGLFEAS